MPNITHQRVTLAELETRNFCEVWEAAQILELDRRIVRDGCASGTIPSTKVGREYRVPVAWLLAQARPDAE